MLSPTKQAIESYIELLRDIWDSLTPNEKLAESMLNDAVKSEVNAKVTGELKQQFLYPYRG